MNLFALTAPLAAGGVVAAAEAAGGGLAINFFWIVVASANFIVFATILYLAFGKQVSGLLASRRERIEQGLRDAEQAKRDRETAEQERLATLAEARRESNDILARAQKVALATRDDALDAYAEGLDLAARELGDERIVAVLRNPARPLRQRIDLVERILAKRVPEQVVKLVGLLVERGKIERLPAVVGEYRRMLNEERGVVEALATTALPLTGDETSALQRKIAEMTGRTVDLRVDVDESLIGGLTVRVGDTLYDASV